MSNLYGLLEEFFTKGLVTELECRVDFDDPKNRTNLPIFPKSEDDKTKGREFVSWKKNNDSLYLVMSHAQAVNLFEERLLLAIQEEGLKHPQVFVNYKKMGVRRNLLEEPHRIYSAQLTEPDATNFYCLLGKDHFSKTPIGEALYDRNLEKRCKAILLHSPTSLLFGCYGSWSGLSSPPKHTSLVEMEIYGVALDEKVRVRQGAGSYMPTMGLSKDTPKPEDAPKDFEWSKAGLANVPMTPEKNMGAIALKDISLTTTFFTERMSGIQVGTKEDKVQVKIYLLALWLHMFFMRCESGFNKYRGRTLSGPSKPENLTMSMTSTNFLIERHKVTQDLRKALVPEPEMYKSLHDEMVQRLVSRKLISLTPIELTACDELDESILSRQYSASSRKAKAIKAKGAVKVPSEDNMRKDS
jgi:hypothetical protein